MDSYGSSSSAAILGALLLLFLSVFGVQLNFEPPCVCVCVSDNIVGDPISFHAGKQNRI